MELEIVCEAVSAGSVVLFLAFRNDKRKKEVAFGDDALPPVGEHFLAKLFSFSFFLSVFFISFFFNEQIERSRLSDNNE